MSERPRVGAGWIALLAALVLALALGALGARHARLMRESVLQLTGIVGSAEQLAGAEPNVVRTGLMNEGVPTDGLPLLGETRHEWSVSVHTEARQVRVRIVCTHAPLLPGPPRIAIVDDGAEGNALFIDDLGKRLRAAALSYPIMRSRP